MVVTVEEGLGAMERFKYGYLQQNVAAVFWDIISSTRFDERERCLKSHASKLCNKKIIDDDDDEQLMQ